MITLILISIILLLLPAAAYADGGGPLLLIINGMTFLYGGIVIIGVEWLIYVHWAKIPKYDAYKDALIANLISTGLVGFGLPLSIAAISGGLSVALPNTIGSYAMAMGTWVYDGMPFPKVMWTSTIFWWVATFFLTVHVEKRVLIKRWKARNYEAAMSARAVSWISNAITYLGLLIFLAGFILYDKYGK